MIVERKHFDIKDRAILSYIAFRPPLDVPHNMVEEGCFIFPLSGEVSIYAADGKTDVDEQSGVLIRCGKYLNRWNRRAKGELTQAIIIHLYPDLVQAIFLNELSNQRKPMAKQEAVNVQLVSINTLIKAYTDSLMFYFKHPSLMSEALIRLKVKELILLLLDTPASAEIFALFQQMFKPQHYSLLQIVEANAFENLTLEELAGLANMSCATFKRKFKSLTGSSPGKYIQQLRLNKSQQLLQRTSDTVAAIAYDCGFTDPNYFTRTFRKRFGLTPLEYRAGA